MPSMAVTAKAPPEASCPADAASFALNHAGLSAAKLKMSSFQFVRSTLLPPSRLLVLVPNAQHSRRTQRRSGLSPLRFQTHVKYPAANFLIITDRARSAKGEDIHCPGNDHAANPEVIKSSRRFNRIWLDDEKYKTDGVMEKLIRVFHGNPGRRYADSGGENAAVRAFRGRWGTHRRRLERL